MKKRNLIFSIILVSIVPALVIAMLAHEVITTDTLSQRSIFNAILLLLGDGLIFAKLFPNVNPKRRAELYKKYEAAYPDLIADNFSDRPKERKELMRAIYLYNTDRYTAALRKLGRLTALARNDDEKFAVMMFTALVFTDMGAPAAAIHIYNEILKFRDNDSRIYSNLGILYMNMGDLENALDAYKKSVEIDPENPFVYSNIAFVFVRNAKYEQAIPFAEKALSLKSNLTAAANALAICHTALGDKQTAEKYIRISVANGTDPNALIDSIKRYTVTLPDDVG